MNLTPIYIANLDSGLETNKKPFALIDQAMQQLFNAYAWRGRIKKRDGTKLAGRLRLVFPAASIGVTTSPVFTINTLYSNYTPPITPEANAEIEPGSVIINIGAGTEIFTDQGNGTLTSNLGNTGTINYLTGVVVLNIAEGAGVATTAAFNYYPSLPVMGISLREIDGINNDQTIFFDQKYAYSYSGTGFQRLSATGQVIWTGTDSNFFWTANYRGSDPGSRLFFVTNNNITPTSYDPMRFYDGITWTTFQPTVGAQKQTQNILNQVIGASFTGTIVPPEPGPIVKGTVTITVENDDDGIVVFRDPKKDGTLQSSGLNSGVIDYGSGVFTLTINPPFVNNATVIIDYNYGISNLWSALILIPYYGRLLALNVWEGPSSGDMTNPQSAADHIYNRCRFSQVGDPTQQDAWRSDVIGKGGFIDAPINQQIISATFYKNTLIVFFEDSTWQLRYVGEYGLPFIWERISSDFGGESTFSPVLFDDGVLAVGDKAIVRSSGVDVKRIDISIPDLVFDFQNNNAGPQRVHGIRDFKKELVYWTYADGNINGNTDGNHFPNRVLVYNYRNNSFAIFRDNITAFGTLNAISTGILWNDTSIFWSDNSVFWQDNVIAQEPLIVGGNQEGFIFFYGYPNLSITNESTVNAMDQETLSITAINIATTPVQITVINHNIEAGDNDEFSQAGEFIYISGMNFLNPITGASVANTLNNNVYLAVPDPTNLNLLYLWQWNYTLQKYVNDFPFIATTSYVGGGRVTLLPRMSITTKDFSPYAPKGLSTKLSYVDFLTDAVKQAYTTVNINIDSSQEFAVNLGVGNQNISDSLSNFGNITNITLSNPGVITTQIPHGLITGDEVTLENILGIVQLNGGEFAITYVSPTQFSIGIDTTGFTAYISGGSYAQTNNPFYVPGSNYAWHRFYCGSNGQFISMQLTYNDDLMNDIKTHQQDFVMNALRMWVKPGSRGVF